MVYFVTAQVFLHFPLSGRGPYSARIPYTKGFSPRNVLPIERRADLDTAIDNYVEE